MIRLWSPYWNEPDHSHMPRKSSPRSKLPRGPAHPDVFQDTPRLISSDEKRELILAHAASRAPQDPLQRMSFWAGIAIAVAVIAGGWWTTVGWQVSQSVNRGGEDLKEVTKRLNEFTEQVDSNPLLKTPSLDGPTTAAAAAELSERIKTALQTSSSSTERQGDLMAPSAPGAPSSTTPTEPGPSPYPINPQTPGLTPAPES